MQRKMDLISGASITICGLLYVLIGFAGYRFGDDVSSNLLESAAIAATPSGSSSRASASPRSSCSRTRSGRSPRAAAFFSLLGTARGRPWRALAARRRGRRWRARRRRPRLHEPVPRAHVGDRRVHRQPRRRAVAARRDGADRVGAHHAAAVFLSMHPAPRPSEIVNDVDESAAAPHTLAVEEARGSAARAMAKVVLVIGAALILLCVTSTLLYEA